MEKNGDLNLSSAHKEEEQTLSLSYKAIRVWFIIHINFIYLFTTYHLNNYFTRLEIIKTNLLRAPKIIKIHYVVTACPCYFWCAFGL